MLKFPPVTKKMQIWNQLPNNNQTFLVAMVQLGLEYFVQRREELTEIFSRQHVGVRTNVKVKVRTPYDAWKVFH